MDLSQMTRAELESMTQAAIIEMILNGVVTEETLERRFDEKTGELIYHRTAIVSAYTGEIVEVNEVEKSYHPGGKLVDTIAVRKYDGKGKVVDAFNVKHSKDGKSNPTKTAVAAPKDLVVKI